MELFTPKEIVEEIRRMADAWHGTQADRLSLSVGFASHSEHPDADIRALQNMADQMMYAEKDRYYNTPGMDRRRTPEPDSAAQKR